MDFEAIILKKENHIATITLNRPERLNAVSPQMREELAIAVEDVATDDDVRVVVITGAGRAFSAGADVTRMPGGSTNTGEERTAEMNRRRLKFGVHRFILGLHRMEKPTIAMVNGISAGGGFDLALACDLRIGCENTRFRNSFVIIGLFPGWGGTWLYTRVMGLPKALEYLFTGDFIDANEALRIGVLNRLVPAAQLEQETMALATKLAKAPPISLRLMKIQAYKGLDISFEMALEMAAACESITDTSHDYKEGLAAFREKREAHYTGK